MLQVKPALDLQQECIEFFEENLGKMHSETEWLLAENDSLRVVLARSFQEGHDDEGEKERREVVKMLIGEG